MAEDEKVVAFEARRVEAGRLHSPSAARNRAAIVAAWGELLPAGGGVLEVGSGTGEHGAALCAAYPDLTWHPSDPDPASRTSQAAWGTDVPDERMRAPLDLDVTVPGWGAMVPSDMRVLFSANMIHISPFSACEGLFAGAGAALAKDGVVALYGPFSRRGAMAESNARFSADLRSRDPSFGVRDLDDQVQPLAARFGFALRAVREMPANNLFVVFERN